MSRVATARDVARAVLAKVEQQGAWATPALAAALRSSGLDPRDRRLAAELVYGVLRQQSRLDRALGAFADLGRTPRPVVRALRVAAYQLIFLDRVPAHAAVDDAVSAARARGGDRLAGFANAVLRKLAAAGEPRLPGDRRARLEIEHSTPAWIVDEVAAALGDAAGGELDAAIAAMNAPPPLWLRVNRTRATPDEVAAALAPTLGRTPAASPLAPGAIDATGLPDPEAADAIVRGLATVQDLGAQLVGHLAAPAAGQRVLDACAGHGGKTTHLAELAGDGAIIDAVDVAAGKLRRAAASARRLGLRSIRTHALELAGAGDALAAAYDLVVLDAPCTGLGVLRRHPEAKWRLGPDDVARATATQAALLDAAAARVGPGGALVYAVCSVAPAEGPAQVDALLARRPDLAIAAPAGGEPAWPAVTDARGCVRVWPHRHAGDGFFAARLVRR